MFLNREDDFRLAEEMQEEAERLQRYVYGELLERTPQGTRKRPGVTNQQLRDAIALLDKVQEQQKFAMAQVRVLNGMLDESAKRRQYWHDLLKDSEERTGKRYSSLARKMFGLE